jgi:general secretion pathway protein H
LVDESKFYVRRAAGFTLLELLVVLVIAGALMALVPPVVSAVVPGTKARVAALDLASTLRDARNMAITRSKNVDVTFDTESASYAIADSRETELPRGVALVILDRSGYVSETRRAAGLLLHPDPTYTLRFYPDGSSNGLRSRLGAASGGYVVAVDWLLGRVSITEAEENAI